LHHLVVELIVHVLAARRTPELLLLPTVMIMTMVVMMMMTAVLVVVVSLTSFFKRLCLKFSSCGEEMKLERFWEHIKMPVKQRECCKSDLAHQIFYVT
jgi:hypothetical protein